MEENEDISLYKSIKKPLLNIICQYFPYKYNLKLGYRSKHYQSLHNFSIETYMYLHFLQRAVDPELCDAVIEIQQHFKNDLNFFPIELFRNSNIIAQWLSIRKSRDTTEEKLNIIFRINLHLHRYAFLLITNQEEYDFYLQFEEDFNDTLLFIHHVGVEEEIDDHLLNSPIKLSSTRNVVYLYLDHLSYFALPFQKLKYLVLAKIEEQFTPKLNQWMPQLDYLKISYGKEVNLQKIEMSFIKYLSIDAGCFVENDNFKHLFSKSFPELLSFKVNRRIAEGEDQQKAKDFHRNQPYSFSKEQFPKLKHVELFEKEGNYLSKLSVISSDWITKKREANDMLLGPLEIDDSVEYWESIREVKLSGIKPFKLNALVLNRFPQFNEQLLLPQLIHLAIPLNHEVDSAALKFLLQRVHQTVTLLNFRSIINKNLFIVLSFQFPQLKELILNDIKCKQSSIEALFTHSLMKTLKTLQLSFWNKGMDLEGVDLLFEKCSFNALESLLCDDLPKVELCLIKSHIPLLRKLTIYSDEMINDLNSLLLHFNLLQSFYMQNTTYGNEIEKLPKDNRALSIRLSFKHLALIIINREVLN